MDDRLTNQQVKLNHFYVILKKASAIFASRLLGLPVLTGSTISYGSMHPNHLISTQVQILHSSQVDIVRHATTQNQHSLSSLSSALGVTYERMDDRLIY